MAYEVRLSRQAVRDLDSLYEEKQAETSVAAAAWYLGLEAAVLSLEEMPLRGSTAPEDPSLRQIFYGRRSNVYRVLYTVDERRRIVNVAQIRHGARQPLRGRQTPG